MTKLQEPFSYTQYNDAILQSAEETAMMESDANHGWYHFSWDTITPTLEEQSTVLHSIWADPWNTTTSTLQRLEQFQHKVDEAVDLAKTRWSRHLAQKIQNMPFNPKGHGKISNGFTVEIWATIPLPLSFIWDYHQDDWRKTMKRTWGCLWATSKKCSITTNRRTERWSTTLTYVRWWGS